MNELKHSGSTQTVRGVNTNLSLDYKFSSWLSVNAVLSYNTGATKSEKYYDEQTYQVSTYRKLPYGYDKSLLDASWLKNLKENICTIPYGGILQSSDDTNNSFTGRVSLSVNKLFRDVHSVSFTAGLDVTSVKYEGYSREEWGYTPDRGKQFVILKNLKDWEYASLEMQKLKPVITDKTTNNISYYGTASYSYKGKYIVSANVRGEGSNKLGEDARFLPVWSFSGRWNVTDERFMEPLIDIISSLGIRSSYGIQANVTDAHNPNMIATLGMLESNSEEYSSTLTQLPNRNLKWEKTYSFNLGIDFSLFKGKISGAFEYYTKTSKDQLMSVEITSTNGAKIVTINGGDLTNKGWDLSLVATPVKTKDFEWRLTFNTGKVRNEVSNAAERSTTYADYLSGSIVKNGYALNSFYSYQFDGLDANGLPTFKGLKDYDGEGNVVIRTREQALASALKYSGKREADITGGLSMAFRYKRLSLNTMFNISLGSKIRLNDLYTGDNFKLPYPAQNMGSDFVKRWKNPGDEKYTNIPSLSDASLTIASQNPDNKGEYMQNSYREIGDNYWQMYNNSDLRVVSGNFVRCRSISLAYSLPSDIVRKMYLKSLSVSLGVTNPFVIKAKGLQGRDPEQVTLGSGTIPPQQTYSFMLNVTF